MPFSNGCLVKMLKKLKAVTSLPNYTVEDPVLKSHANDGTQQEWVLTFAWIDLQA